MNQTFIVRVLLLELGIPWKIWFWTSLYSVRQVFILPWNWIPTRQLLILRIFWLNRNWIHNWGSIISIRSWKHLRGLIDGFGFCQIVLQLSILILILQRFTSTKSSDIQVWCNDIVGRFFPQVNVNVDQFTVYVFVVPLSMSIELYWFWSNIYWWSFRVLWARWFQFVSAACRWCYFMNGFLAKLFLLNLTNLIDWHYRVLLWCLIVWRYKFWCSALNILALLDCSWWLTINWGGLEMFWVDLRL